MSAFDFKKEYKEQYMPKDKPAILEVPSMTYLCVSGKGNPNTSNEYKESIEILYGLSYAIKMSKKKGKQPDGYFDFVVPPLEGFWQIEDETWNGGMIQDKEKLCWTSLIRQPEFVTEEVLKEAKLTLQQKKPTLDLSKASRIVLTEGLCVQIMHHGSYDEEPSTIQKMDAYAIDLGYTIDINEKRRHHEIYLNDARKTPEGKRKTIIRHPIVKC